MARCHFSTTIRSMRNVPHNATLLYSMSADYGGDTLFASGYAVRDARSCDQVEARAAAPSITTITVPPRAAGDRGPSIQRVDSPRVPHSMTRPDASDSVNRLMTVRSRTCPAESDALLAALFDHSEKPEFVYDMSGG